MSLTPIVLVPGIMGTRLALPSPSLLMPHWDPDDTTSLAKFFTLGENERVSHMSITSRPIATPMTNFSAMPLALSAIPYFSNLAAAVGQTIENLFISRGWASVAWTYYGELLVTLETTLNIAIPFLTPVINFPVYAFGYDWRLSNAFNGVRLQSFISNVLTETGAAQVIVVTHSMGGLVARSAVMDVTTRAQVKAVIHVAQPANGAVVAYRRCLTGFDPTFDSAGGFSETQFFKSLFGSTNRSYIRMMAGMPSAFELLPNHRYHLLQPIPWLDTGNAIDFDNIYDVYTNDVQPGIIPAGIVIALGPIDGTLLRSQIETNILAAKTFHLALGEFLHNKTVVLFGTGLKTDDRVMISSSSISADQPTKGDGTVSESSAGLSNFITPVIVSRTGFSGAEHAGIFKDMSIVPNVPSAVTLSIQNLMPTL
jgi:pimeloyl-ACP methyl ester carboxylesterase